MINPYDEVRLTLHAAGVRSLADLQVLSGGDVTQDERDRLARIERKLDEALAAHNQMAAALAEILERLSRATVTITPGKARG